MHREISDVHHSSQQSLKQWSDFIDICKQEQSRDSELDKLLRQ